MRTEDVDLSSARIPGTWECLEKVLTPYRTAKKVKTVYEAGVSGFWLYRKIMAWGGGCLVTPPSHLPQESGNRVKTDRKDSQKLAHLLAKRLLRGIFIPTKEDLSHRDVFRRRQGLVTDRTRVMNRIRSKLLFLGLFLPEELSDWSVAFVKYLRGLRLTDRWEQEGFDRLLEEYESQTQMINNQTKLLRELAKTDVYRTDVDLLKSFSEMGILTAMSLLLEQGTCPVFSTRASPRRMPGSRHHNTQAERESVWDVIPGWESMFSEAFSSSWAGERSLRTAYWEDTTELCAPAAEEREPLSLSPVGFF
ncbi:MAG: transposase [Nitrospiraceae bacterium]|nr:transposase [Nitrospiraceae bacterium]